MHEVSPKRFEENIKFIFKLTFKKLKSTLLKKNRISFYSKKFDCQFYNYYFLDISTKQNTSIEEFYDPLNCKGSTKTLNNDYLKLVFTSPQFKKDFIEYLDDGSLVRDYHTNLRRKVKQLLFKFDHFCDYNDPIGMRQDILAIQRYFRRNKQCKLPWLHSEVVTAIDTFKILINSFQS